MNISKIIIFSMLALLVSCAKFAEERAFDIDQRHIIGMAQDMLAQSDSICYADQWVADAIACDTCSLWVNQLGVVASADTLLTFLQRVGDEGLSLDFFHVAQVQAHVDSVRAWAQSDRFELLTDTIAAEIEAALTQAYLRYAYGQRYGYLLPHNLYNNLLLDYDSPPDKPRPYRKLFDIHCDVPTDSLSRVAIGCLRSDSIGDFLRSIQPQGKLHKALCNEYRRAVETGDTVLIAKALANIERSRWRYERPDTGRYVWVNLASQMLRAVDEHRDSCIEMRICCGNLTHKSPMLMSRLSYIELNPYWNVPLSILRNEVAKLHLNDSAYFARNNMMVIDNSTKESVDPTKLTAAQWCSGRYSMKQDKGDGNSLGRMVFRFPNTFAVYLHDTNSPGAFNRERRTVSHGCIRVQRPMDLASFLLSPNVTPLYLDRVRMSIDLPPLTDQGRRLKEQNPKPLPRCDLKPTVPLWIDYYTLYPDRQDKMCEYPDIYSYDKAITDALAPLLP